VTIAVKMICPRREISAQSREMETVRQWLLRGTYFWATR
jgi:hypothetical protein